MSRFYLKINQKSFKKAIFGFVVLAVMTLPVFVFSSRRSEIYVDAKASGVQDGSKNHPYNSITEAISHAKDRTEIHVAKGEYEENVLLKDGIKLIGKDKKETILKAKKDKWSTVAMRNNSSIDNFTIQDGKRGIWIENDAKVNISNCIIKNNEDDGIEIEGGDTREVNQVSISKSEIRDNGWDGIYSTGPRRVSISDSEVKDNKKDGINLAGNTIAWIYGNSIKENSGSGMKLILDQSSISINKNDIRSNNREGIEVASYGGIGRIDISKSKIVKNARFGIARLQRAGNINWGTSLTFSVQPELWENRFGGISNVIYLR